MRINSTVLMAFQFSLRQYPEDGVYAYETIENHITHNADDTVVFIQIMRFSIKDVHDNLIAELSTKYGLDIVEVGTVTDDELARSVFDVMQERYVAKFNVLLTESQLPLVPQQDIHVQEPITLTVPEES